MKKIMLIILITLFMMNSTLKSNDMDTSFQAFINCFQTIELPYKIDVIMMKELIKKYSHPNKITDSHKLNNRILKKAVAKILKINPKKLNLFPTYYPLGKLEFDSVIFTFVFYIGKEYGASDIPSYSIEIELFIFDYQGVFIDEMAISKYLNSKFPIFSIESEIDAKINLKRTYKSYSETIRNKIIEQSTDYYIFNKETKQFEEIDKNK